MKKIFFPCATSARIRCCSGDNSASRDPVDVLVIGRLENTGSGVIRSITGLISGGMQFDSFLSALWLTRLVGLIGETMVVADDFDETEFIDKEEAIEEIEDDEIVVEQTGLSFGGESSVRSIISISVVLAFFLGLSSSTSRRFESFMESYEK